MKLTTVSAALLSLVALATAAPVKFTAVRVDEPLPHHFRIGHAGAGASHKSYITPKDGEPEILEVEVIQILPMPADFDPKFTSPPFVPPGRIRPAIMPPLEVIDLPAIAPAVEPAFAGKRPCHGAMGKSVDISNWFRHAVGMPAIAPDVAVSYAAGPMAAHPHRHRVHKHGHKHKQWMKNWHKRPFADRLTHALMSLGPWEGRLVAFVLGCGIGVLIRLAWVMSVLIVRSIRGSARHEDEEEDDEELTEEEQYLLPPPEYTDEKVAIVVIEERQAN